jgi:hypothetical protein
MSFIAHITLLQHNNNNLYINDYDVMYNINCVHARFISSFLKSKWSIQAAQNKFHMKNLIEYQFFLNFFTNFLLSL